MKFVRDAHPPRLRGTRRDRGGRARSAEDEAPFGTIAAVGFDLPGLGLQPLRPPAGPRGLALLRRPSRRRAPGLRGDEPFDDGIAEFGIAATLETARGRGCQLALLHRRILDAAEAGCHTLFVETGERVPDRPSASYRNILRAGFEEAYLRPNWTTTAT